VPCLRKSFCQGNHLCRLKQHNKGNEQWRWRTPKKDGKNAQWHIINQTTYKIWIFYTFFAFISRRFSPEILLWCLFLFRSSLSRLLAPLHHIFFLHFDLIVPRYIAHPLLCSWRYDSNLWLHKSVTCFLFFLLSLHRVRISRGSVSEIYKSFYDFTKKKTTLHSTWIC
jgi:hypothetical protein